MRERACRQAEAACSEEGSLRDGLEEAWEESDCAVC